MAMHRLFVKYPSFWEVWAFSITLRNKAESYVLMLTIVFIDCTIPSSRPSFFFLEVLSTLQKIVWSQSAVVEGLFVSCSAVSIISTDALYCFLKKYFLTVIPHTGYSGNMTTLCLCCREMRPRIYFWGWNLWKSAMRAEKNRYDCGDCKS